MNVTAADEAVKHVLSEKRYAHTIRVMETAEKLSHQYGGDSEGIKLSALLHDYAKCFTIDELKHNIKKYNLPTSLLDYHYELWHGPVSAAIMKHEYGIHDQDVLNAIYYHTTGRVDMTTVENIIFVADYIEPGRSFPGVESVRELAKTDLMLAARAAIKNTITYLMTKDSVIHPDSFYMYNVLTKKNKGAINR